jgi:hypothetical protein
VIKSVSALPTEWPETLDGDSSIFAERLYLETACGLGGAQPVFLWVSNETGAFAGLALQIENRKENRISVRALTGLKNGQVPWSGLATRGDYAPLLPELVAKLNAYPCDLIQIGSFTESDSATNALVAAIKETASGELTIEDGEDCIVEGVANHEDYKRTLTVNARRNLSKVQNRMAKMEGFESKLFTKKDALEGFSHFVEVDKHSWKGAHQSGEAIANHPDIQAHFKSIISKLARNDEILISVQFLQGSPVAATMAMIHRGWGYGFKSSYLATDEYRTLSLGMVSIFDAVGHLVAREDVNNVTLLSHYGYAARLATGTQKIRLATVWRPTWRTRAVGLAKALRKVISRPPAP